MHRNIWVAFIVIYTVLCHGDIVNAGDSNDMQIHGFASQGYLDTTNNDYLGKTKGGSYQFNEMAISFAGPLTDDLRFGCQFFSRDIGDYGNNELTVAWAFLDYRWRDWLGFRAGKIKTPFGLYNRQRDADMLRTFILLPSSVYSEVYREMTKAIQGASMYGSFDLGVAGEIEYEVSAGTFDIEPQLSILSLEVSHIETGMLIWNTPIRGLRFSITDTQGKGDLIYNGQEAGSFPIDESSVGSVEYERGDFKLSAEYTRTRANGSSRSLDLDIPIKYTGWYVSGSWSIFNWLQLGAYYSDHKDNNFREYPLHDNFFNRSIDWDYYTYQKDTTLSVRFNVNSWWCIKFEAHFIEGVGRFEEREKVDMSTLEPIPLEKNWNLYAVKTSLHF